MGSDMPQWVSVSLTSEASPWPCVRGSGCLSEQRLSDRVGMLTSRHTDSTLRPLAEADAIT